MASGEFQLGRFAANDAEARMQYAGWPKELRELHDLLATYELTTDEQEKKTITFPALDGLQILTLLVSLAPSRSGRVFELRDLFEDWAELLRLHSTPVQGDYLVSMHNHFAGFEHFFREGGKLLSVIVNGLHAEPTKNFSLLAKAKAELHTDSGDESDAYHGRFPGYTPDLAAITPSFVFEKVTNELGQRRYEIKPESENSSLILALASLIFLNDEVIPYRDFQFTYPRLSGTHQFMGTTQLLGLICKHFFGGVSEGEYGLQLKDKIFRQLDEILANQEPPAPQDS